ncbi:hypothetical protein L345_15472, partial [Ophiophagus hannah]
MEGRKDGRKRKRKERKKREEKKERGGKEGKKEKESWIVFLQTFHDPTRSHHQCYKGVGLEEEEACGVFVHVAASKASSQTIKGQERGNAEKQAGGGHNTLMMFPSWVMQGLQENHQAQSAPGSTY